MEKELSVEEEKRLIELIHEEGYHFLDKNDCVAEGWIITPSRREYSVEELLEIKSQRLKFGDREQIEKIKALEFYELVYRKEYHLRGRRLSDLF